MSEYNFKSSEPLFARIKEDLSSYDSVGLIDEGKFYQYIKYIIDTLGISFYEEKDAILYVKQFKADLPVDFSILDIAYKCTPFTTTAPQPDCLQWTFVGYNKITEQQSSADACMINCIGDPNPTQVISQFYVKDVPVINTYHMPFILRLSKNVSRDRCTENCKNKYVSHSPYEISIDNRYVYTNFDNDSIYMKYYAFPVDEDGLPMIPDNAIIEDCIEYYIKYRLFEQMHLNGDDANIERKVVMLKQLADEKMKEAKFFGKFPKFETMVGVIRDTRKRFNIYQLNVSPLRRRF